MPFTATRSTKFATTVAAIGFSFVSSAAFGQNSDHDWQKTYRLGGSAALTVETGDSGLEIHSCGDCKEIRIHAESTRKLSEYTLEEHRTSAFALSGMRAGRQR